jgi:cytochrome c oxidase subunit 1
VTTPTFSEPRPELVTREIPRTDKPWLEAASNGDHKAVARLYLGTAGTFLAVAALLFALTRLQLIVPDNTMIQPEIFYRLLSALQASAVIFFAVPLFCGLISYIVPLQIGARGVALPRLHQVSYWLYAIGALTFFASFLYAVPENPLAPFAPLAYQEYSVTNGTDAWIAGVGLAVLGFLCWAISMAVTLHTMRAPGMAWRRAPIFAWAAASISYVLLVIAPVFLAGLTMLMVDRRFDGHFFNALEGGSPLLFSHLAWIFFAGVHAIILIGAMGAISEIIPTFARKPLFSRGAVAGSLVAIAVLGVAAYMQNLYTAPLALGVQYATMIVALALLVPVGLILFNWVATLWDGSIAPRAPLALAVAATVLLVIGLAGELMTAVMPVAWQLENTTVAQADTILILLGGTVLGGFAALHYWLPKITGRAVGEGLAKAAAGLIVAGALVFFVCMTFAGLEGQPVDVYRFFDGSGLNAYNLIASIAAFLIALGVLLELGNLAYSYNNGRRVGHDPWGGSTLEWFALSPPPPHNFDAVPDVRSAEPLRDIREAVRARERAYAPPKPLPRSEPAASGADRAGDGPAVA